MKKLSLALSLAFGATALADVPALINYQGRLVNGVGNPVTGSKEFKLDIYDSQTEGTLIYQETLPDITLDEDGAYSFQFGAGVSRTETSEIIATGDGETLLFQTRLEQTPFGPITVTDGTNSFTQGDVATGEEPFTFLYVRGLNRINLVCNEPPAAGVKFTATYRYNEAGIVGALGTAAEHWMEVTIGGEKQEPRQRLVAVPFALTARDVIKKPQTVRLNFGWTNEAGVTKFIDASSFRRTSVLDQLGDRMSTRTPNPSSTGNNYRYLGHGELLDVIENFYLTGDLDRWAGEIKVALESKSDQQDFWREEWQTTAVFPNQSSESFEIKGEGLNIGSDKSNKSWRINVSWDRTRGSYAYFNSCRISGR
ncbi:hypothetical protein N8491_03295 [Akkermansiaceae bacterium]|nr:hypothetical protein [Akkermansiaceae bacterium]MDA8958570.1 hypothetical protein [bacterium]MDB4395747.1 hypothetical protein [Akkermansiaceae bacterium]